jgi:CO dehydrogenase/acetyl-CoA synthase beta subunit
VAKSKPKKPRKTITERVEAVLARAMHDYADYCEGERALGGSYWVVFPREHSAFSRARRSILRLLREVARG